MLDRLRRLYNRIDRLFDRSALTGELRSEHQLLGRDQPVTARVALAQLLPLVWGVERDARLTLIVAPQGLDRQGRATCWELLFDLPSRRARLRCEWQLAWDEAADGYGAARALLVATPFPPPESALRQLAREGKLLERQLAGMWRAERRGRRELPLDFRDSDAALEELLRQGLEPDLHEHAISSGESPEGRLCWVARTRDQSYYVAFERHACS